MKKAFVTATFFILASIPKPGMSATENVMNATNRVAQNALERIQKSSISKIDIISIPAHILTRTAITQEGIEHSYYYKITMQNMRDTDLYQSFDRALLSTTAKPKSFQSDLRLGIIFYNEKGRRIGAVYFNESGNAGAVDGDNAFLGGGLHDWVSKNFPNILK